MPVVDIMMKQMSHCPPPPFFECLWGPFLVMLWFACSLQLMIFCQFCFTANNACNSLRLEHVIITALLFARYNSVINLQQLSKVPGLRSRSFWVESDFFVRFRLRMSNWFIFCITLQIGNSCCNGAISFEIFVETDFLLCATISADFNSQISFPLC